MAALHEDGLTRASAAEAIRDLIEEIRLVPKDGNLKMELYGELVALISLANEHPRSKGTGVQVTLVAGARYQRESPMLWAKGAHGSKRAPDGNKREDYRMSGCLLLTRNRTSETSPMNVRR